MHIAGCFLEYDGKFVILLRHSHKPDGDTWGLPGGKVEADETSETAVLRELEEETGYAAARSELEHLGDFEFISSRNQPYVYTAYSIKLQAPHKVRLEDAAHAEYRWVTARECDALPNLILDFDNLLRLVGYV